MKRVWLLFAQVVTVLLAAYFVVATLQPQWLKPGKAVLPASPGVAVIEAPPSAPGDTPTASFRNAVKRAAPSVVSINTSKNTRHPNMNDPWFRFFFGEQNAQPQAGLGSGVIVSADGYVLTNNHVIEGADEIEVVLTDARAARAKVVGTDPDSDLAVLKIDLPNLPVMAFADSDASEVGDRVLAIGNPFGVGQTVTSGIVSALGRNQLGINTYENFIQTDAAINPGNSGGALVNIDGALLGINTAIYSRSGGSMGIGFAIPSATARTVLNAIVRDGRVTRGWIGIEPSDLTPQLAQTFGANVNAGVIVTGVLQNGPAARAGLLPGDVITQIGDQAVRNSAELLTRVSQLQPGAPVAFQLIRRGQALTLEVTPNVRPSQQRTRQR
ncbi:2-alkenal reductase [Comamonas serinivorans]|uniref:2-alkenal reductase n=1 Tax=Comamonas serinivorans TaxID=1082851 RepID=A0A1Y0EQV2_9BURK|nr:trypsin-like peptidase domain-containing protein [Comamonas serinivorans]ARU05956.1 2-alkenal reductase [Comamonas serinivorans]